MVEESKEIALIAIFFSIIIGAGLDSFVHESALFETLTKIYQSELESSYLLPSIPSLAFFVAAFVFVLFHWITYNKIIEIHPYQEILAQLSVYRRLFIDIMIFSTIFLIMVVSPTIYKDESLYTFIVFVLSITIFHILSFFYWKGLTSKIHNIDSNTQSRKKSSDSDDIFDSWVDVNIHRKMCIFFVLISITSIGIVIFLHTQFLKQAIVVGLMITVVGLILNYSIKRYLRYKDFDEGKLIEFEELDDRTWDNSGRPKFYPHYKYYNRKECIFYHVRISNKHKERTLHNCMVYLFGYQPIGEVKDPVRAREKLDPVEFKWKGVEGKDVLITPSGFRDFDAFYVDNSQPNVIRLGYNAHITDFTYYPEAFALYEKHYVLTFRAYSLNFPYKEQMFLVHNDGRIYTADEKDQINSNLPNNSKYHKLENILKCKLCKEDNLINDPALANDPVINHQLKKLTKEAKV